MKLQYWVTLTAATAFWQPACVSAQGLQDGLHMPVPQSPANQPPGAGSFLSHINPILPNRRVPGLAPPQSSDNHPITPDKAWPNQLRSVKPVRPLVKSGAGNMGNSDGLLGKGAPGAQGPLDSTSGADGLLGQ